MGDAARIGAALGVEVRRRARLHGGDLSQVERLWLSDGRRVIVKHGARVASEARMLAAIRRVGVAAPEVLCVGEGFFVMADIAETAAADGGWRALGRGLRRLHGCVAERFGWAEDYGFGPVEIGNAPDACWPRFWAEKRLMPLADALPVPLRGRLEALCGRLGALLPERPPAALLHGDLWVGNVLFSRDEAWLIDPACYHGHAEVDLAMLTLFGAPPPAFHQGYGPLEDGAQARRPLYQLWPALVHLRLFGEGYLELVRRLLERVGA